MERNRRLVCLLMLILIFILSLSGCGLKKDVAITVDAFFEDVNTGRYTDRVFRSDYATDDPFSGVEVNDERLWLYIEEGLTRVLHTMGKVSGKSSDETISCIVMLEVIDVASVYATTDLMGYDEVTLFEAMFRPLAPTKEIEVTLFLEHDEQNDNWVISDSSDFVEKFLEPYLEMALPYGQSPEEAFAIYFETVATDYSDVVIDYDNIEESELFHEYMTSFLDATYYDITAIYTAGTTTHLEVEVYLPSPDISYEVWTDLDIFYDIMRDRLIMAYDQEVLTDLQWLDYYLQGFIRLLNSRNFSYEPIYYSVSMSYNVDQQEWNVINVDIDDFHYMYLFGVGEENVDLFFEDFDDEFDTITSQIVDDLLDEGVFTASEINRAIDFYNANID